MYIWGNMKRFFVVSAFSCVISIILTILFDLEIAYVIALGILSIISGILLYIFKKKYFINIICFGIILILISNYSSGFARKEINNVKVLYDKTAKISASIIEEPIDKQYYHVCYVKTSFIDAENTPQNVKIRLTIYGDFKADIYDELRAEVNFKKPNKYIIKSSYSDGYYLSGVVNDFEVVETSVKPLYSKAVYLRNKINSLFSKNDNYGISSAMLIGNKDALSDEFYKDIKKTGMSHIMAVSGFHISIICGSIMLLLRKLKINRKYSSIIGMASVITLAAVSGFSGSILRAGLMFFIIFCANLFSRKADALNSLGFAITILLIYNPFNIYDISFLLSSAGTLGIVLLVPKFNEKIEDKIPKNLLGKVLYYFINIFFVSIAASLFTMPISLYYFGYSCIISPIINIFVTIPAYFIMISGLVLLIFNKIPILSDIIIFINNLSCKIFKVIIETFADFKYIGLESDDIFLYVLIMISIILFLLYKIFKSKKFVSLILVITFVISCGGCLFAQDFIELKTTKLTFIDSQKSPCLVINRGEHIAVIGTGGSNQTYKSIENVMASEFIDKIDLLILPSDNEEYHKSYDLLIKNYNIKKVVTHKDYRISDTIKKYLEIEGINLTLWNDIDIKSIKNSIGYDILINIDGETILFDVNGEGYDSDYILTSKPIEIFYKSELKTSYIIFQEMNCAINSSKVLTEKGCNTALTSGFGEIYATKYDEKPLKFYR